MNDSALAALDKKAKENLDLVFYLVPEKAIKKPNIINIYFNPGRAKLTIVPPELQLEWLCKNYNELARIGFFAADTQDFELARGLWYYSLDSEHSFSCHHRMTRYNLIAMAYLWANDFPPEFYGDGDEIRNFVMAYIGAWFAYLCDGSNLDKDPFEDQEKFLAMWKDSELDLFTIRNNKELRGVKNLMKKLGKQPLPSSLQNIVELEADKIVYMRQDGEISDDDYARYGPALILEFVLANGEIGADLFNKRHKLNAIYEQELTKRMAPGPGGLISLDEVDWECELVDSLHNAVDPTLPHPKAIDRKPRCDTTRRPWLDVDTFFKILRSGFEEMNKDEYALTMSMGSTSLASGAEELKNGGDDMILD